MKRFKLISLYDKNIVLTQGTYTECREKQLSCGVIGCILSKIVKNGE